MSDASAAPSAPAVTPGNSTSEFKVTVVASVLSILATITGVALDLLQSAQDAGVQGKWLTLALSIFGVIGMVLTAIGYQITRAHVKAAASNAAAAASVASTPDAAAAALGAVR